VAFVFDILHTEIEAGKFEVVAAAAPNTILLTGIGGAADLDIANAHGRRWFAAGDHFKLANMWLAFPYCFGLGEEAVGAADDGGARVSLVWVGADAVQYSIPELGIGVAGEGALGIPEFNCPIPFPEGGLFIKVPVLPLQSYRLALVDPVQIPVSMVSLPASLIGVTIRPILYLEVLHTKQMQSIP
jgi:hypothetical protein